jgi:hypothetical protein
MDNIYLTGMLNQKEHSSWNDDCAFGSLSYQPYNILDSISFSSGLNRKLGRSHKEEDEQQLVMSSAGKLTILLSRILSLVAFNTWSLLLRQRLQQEVLVIVLYLDKRRVIEAQMQQLLIKRVTVTWCSLDMRTG